MTYNREDCQILKLLVDELSKIQYSANTLSDIDFANQPKQYITETSKEVHSQFEAILKFATTKYEKSKISFSQGQVSRQNSRVGRLNWRPIFDRILDLVAHHRCLHG